MKYFTALLLGLVHFLAFSANQPDDDDKIEREGTFVYWASSIPPITMLRVGLWPTGRGTDNLQRIALNVNCLATHDPSVQGSSSLIVGTEIRLLAEQETIQMSYANPGQDFYIYSISSDVDWRGLAGSLRIAYLDRRDMASLAAVHRDRRTRIAWAGVPAGYIFRYRHYRNGELVAIGTNSRYNGNSNHTRSARTYVPTDRGFDPGQDFAYASVRGWVIPACMAISLCAYGKPQFLSTGAGAATSDRCPNVTYGRAPVSTYLARLRLPILFAIE